MASSSCLKDAGATFTCVVVRGGGGNNSSLLKEAPAASYLCALCEPGLYICQEGAEIDWPV